VSRATFWLSGLALTAALSSCSTATGNAETDRIATTVAQAISSPRQASAVGLVRAARVTRAGKLGQLVVIEATDVDADRIVDPLARFVFRVHLDGADKGFSSSDPITACYAARFSFYGVISTPRRLKCLPAGRAIVPAVLPAAPRAVIPADFDATLARLLGALPVTPTAAQLKARVLQGLPAPSVDPNSGRAYLAPTVATALSGSDVGVALWEPEDRGCLLGARIGGEVIVGRPSRVQLQPGEARCDGQTALTLPRLRPPH
jgi:hypothetical protein